jgi:Skp family chaperone for outer membrane proteins
MFASRPMVCHRPSKEQESRTVKKTVIVMAGAAVLSLAVFISSNVSAQTTPSTPPAPTNKSRVALLNLTYVVKNYTKFKTFQDELKAAVDPFQAKDAAWKKEGEALVKESQAPATTQQKREEIEAKLKDLQRKIEDNKVEASKVLNKKQGEQLKILYNDVRVAAWRHASAHGIDMVLHYNDAITEADYNSEPNISRKMQAGALMPIYMANGVDVSVQIVQLLNQSGGGGTGGTTPPSTTPAAKGGR